MTASKRHRPACLCPPCRADRKAYVVASRAAQGLPPTVTDPIAVALVVQGIKDAARRQVDAA